MEQTLEFRGEVARAQPSVQLMVRRATGVLSHIHLQPRSGPGPERKTVCLKVSFAWKAGAALSGFPPP